MTVPAELYSSDREFKVWSFAVTHGELVLRSPGGENDERIDLVFKAAREMHLRRSYSRLTVSVDASGVHGRDYVEFHLSDSLGARDRVIAMALFLSMDNRGDFEESTFEVNGVQLWPELKRV